jgi:hypothetical protein
VLLTAEQASEREMISLYDGGALITDRPNPNLSGSPPLRKNEHEMLLEQLVLQDCTSTRSVERPAQSNRLTLLMN